MWYYLVRRVEPVIALDRAGIVGGAHTGKPSFSFLQKIALQAKTGDKNAGKLGTLLITLIAARCRAVSKGPRKPAHVRQIRRSSIPASRSTVGLSGQIDR